MKPDSKEIDNILLGVRMELDRARVKFKDFASAHEGYAIIREELDEMWTEIKNNHLGLARAEACQVAAMAIRFLLDIRNISQMDNTRDGDPK